jgi:Zn-dependent protease
MDCRAPTAGGPAVRTPGVDVVERIIEDLSRFLYEIPAILLAISIHEYCHGIVARRFGDDTASEMRQLTPNPLPRIDLVGFLMFLWFRYGWARDIPVDYRKLGPSRWKALGVIAAGIAGNFLLSVFFIFLLKLKKPVPESYFFNFIGYSIVLNFNMVLINLLPVLPLDGGKVVRLYWPDYERFVFPGVVFVVLLSLTGFSKWVQHLSSTIFGWFI